MGSFHFFLLLAAKTVSFELHSITLCYLNLFIFFLLHLGNGRNDESLMFLEFLMGVDDCRGV